MIALSQPEEAARGQDDIGDLTGPLVEDELVDSAKFVAIAAMHSLPPHIVGRNQDAGCEGTGNGYFCIDGHGHSPFNKSPGRQAIAHRAENVQLGRAPCRESVCQYVLISVVAVSLKKQQENDTIKED